MVISYDLKLVCVSATNLRVKAAELFRVWSGGFGLGSRQDKSTLKSSNMNSLQSVRIWPDQVVATARHVTKQEATASL